MRRNKLLSRIEKRKTLRKRNDSVNDMENYQEVSDAIYETVVDILDLNQMLDTMAPYEILNKMLLASTTIEAQQNLKNLVRILEVEYERNKKKNNYSINTIDPTLDYRFLNRKSSKHFNIPEIRSHLKWQKGEFPFFKIEIRHYTKSQELFNNKRFTMRHVKSFAQKDPNSDEYYIMEQPTDHWPKKGTLFITNQRLFFKKTGKDTFNIPFENILSYHFYGNGIQIEHTKLNQKFIDVFFVDVEKALLLETMIKMTL